MHKACLLLSLVIGSFFFLTPTTYAMDSTTLPLSGSFFMNDTNATSVQIKTMVDEMAATGINTIIILAAGYLDKPSGTYKETNYLDDANNRTRDVMKYANSHGMDIYIGLAAYDMNVVQHWVGSPTDSNSDQGRLIDYSVRLIANINNFANSQGIPLSRIKGYYLGEFAPAHLATPSVNELIFWKHLSERVKSVAPDKKILISPYVLDENSYSYMKSVYENVYRETKIDIIAPQDSMGSLKVTSFAKSAELFSALRDATAEFPGKTAWANIETQLQPSVTDGNYNPSNIDRVSGQIEAAAPHVTKMITWIYQHTMLSTTEFDNVYSWTGQYTLSRANARRSLRSAYLAKYGPKSVMYFYHKTNHACQSTSSQYSDVNLCQSNLSQYLPNLTTGICYPTLSTCQSANTTTYLPGDLNTDGKVDIFDYNLLVSKFGNPYTIFDYNNLVSNYGKTTN